MKTLQHFSAVVGFVFLNLFAKALIRDCKSLSEKGLYCFDISDKAGIDYEIISCPEKPIMVDSLPKNIYAIMQLHNMNTSFAASNGIAIEK